MSISRKNTNQLLTFLDEGLLNPYQVLKNMMNFLSEAEITEFLESNGYEYILDEEDEEDESEESDED